MVRATFMAIGACDFMAMKTLLLMSVDKAGFTFVTI